MGIEIVLVRCILNTKKVLSRGEGKLGQGNSHILNGQSHLLTLKATWFPDSRLVEDYFSLSGVQISGIRNEQIQSEWIALPCYKGSTNLFFPKPSPLYQHPELQENQARDFRKPK